MAIAITVLAAVSVAFGIAALAGCVAAGKADDAVDMMSRASEKSDQRKAA